MAYVVSVVLAVAAFCLSLYLSNKKIKEEKDSIISTQKEKINKLEEELWNLQGKVLENEEKIDNLTQQLYVPKTKAEKVFDKVLEADKVAKKINNILNKDNI